MKLLRILAVTGMLALWMSPVAWPAEQSTESKVLVVTLDGTIDPVADEFVGQAIDRATDERFDALLIEMDTPGGLMTSMDSIIKRILAARSLPVIVYVAPEGARAASAGVFITMAGDIAAMAPSTNIGSATPVQGQGGKDLPKDMRAKVINDAASRIKALAEEHGRNGVWAERAVRKAVNIDAREALKLGVVDEVADSRGQLLEAVDGQTTKPKKLTLHTAGAKTTTMDLPTHLRLLKIIIDPNILFLLFTLGIVGIGFEVTHPGTIAPGVIGVISLIIALFGFQVLPINYAGVLLIVLAFALFVAEAFVASHGILGAGGVAALVLGGTFLFERGSGLSVDLPLIIFVAVLFALFFGVLVTKAIQARLRQPDVGAESLSGRRAVVRTPLDPEGQVFLDGSFWLARLAPGTQASVGDEVVVESIEGLRVTVRPVQSGDTAPAGAVEGGTQ